MKYPTLQEVKEADHEQICRWHRFLPSGTTTDEAEIMRKIYAKYIAGGQMTPEISKRIGWG